MKKLTLIIACLFISLFGIASNTIASDSCNATITITASPSDSSCQGIVTSGSGPDQVVISNGSPITLTASGGVTYYWNTGSTTDTIKVNNPGTYTVNATDANGCTGSAIITIYPGSAYNVSMINSVSNNSLCSLGFTPGRPDEAFFIVSVNGAGSGSFRTEWMTTGGAVLASGQGNPQAQVSFSDITQGGTVIVAVTPINNFGHPIACTKIDSTVIKGCPCSTYYPLVSVNSPTLCAGSSTTLTASGFAKTYLWSTGATTQSITVSPTTTTTYSVTGSFVPGSAGNCSQTQTATVTVVTPKTLTITPPAISYCAGNFQATQLTATQGFNSYQWSNGDNNYFTEDVTGQTYSVTAVDSNGCNVTDSVVSTAYPAPTVTITPSAASICSGSSATLTASGANTYLWSDGETTASIAVSPTATTTYSVTGTSAQGCTGTASQSITVNPAPSIVISASTAAICTGGSATLTASGASTYIWSDGETTSSITILATPSTNTSYTVTGTDANGCIGTATDGIVINLTPVVSIVALSDTICPGGAITLSARVSSFKTKVSHTVSRDTYLWSDGETTSSITVSPTATTTYTVTITTAGGCPGTGTLTITVTPEPTISISASSNTICSGNSATLTASGAAAYIWSDGETTSTITVSPTTSTTYSVTGTSAPGCSGTASQLITVNSSKLPHVKTNDKDSVCIGDSVTIRASGAVTYVWSTGATTSTITVAPSVATTYTVIGTNANGCYGIAGDTIKINPAPALTIMTTAAILCKGSSVTMTVSGANKYKWSNGSTDGSITATPNASKVFTVTGTNGYGCKSSDSIKITVQNCPVINQTDSIDKRRLICGTNAESADSLVRAERANHGPYGNGPVTWSGPTGSVKYCWPFAFYFDDIGTGNGFDPASGYGTAAQNTLCAAGQYIASVFDFSAIGATNYITIHVNSSIISGGAPYYAIAGPNRTYAVDGTTTWPNQGVYAGDVFDHTVNGVDPSLGTTFNGILTVNFSGVVTGSYPTYFTYLYDYTQPINNCQMDLYSVFVHELTHTMGFISDVVEGTPTPVCYSGSAFSLYDWDFLFHAASTISIGNPNPGMTKLVSGTTTPTDYTTPEINPGLTGIDAVGDANLWLYDMGGRNVTSGTNNNQPVYSGCPYNTFLNVPGSYISHLDESFTSWTTRTVQAPGYQPDYVMAPFGLPGRLKREYTLPEVRALLYLKNPKTLKTYTLLSTYKNAAIINNNPPVVTNAAQYTTTDQSYQDLKVVPDAVITNSGTYTYNVANDISNGIAYDPDAGDQLQIMPGTIYNIQGCGSNGNNNDAQLSFSGSPITSITFTPRTNFIGRAQFGFYLYDGKEQGAFRVVTVDVTQDPTFVNIPNVNTPAGLTELVVNGDYEEGIHCATLADNFAVSSIMKCYELEGPYIWGNQFADAHPLEIYGWGWTAGSGENITGSYNDCSGPNTQEFGDFQFSNNYGFWPSKPLPNPKPSGTSYRYHNFVSNINWSTLASPTVGTPPVQECNQYTLVFDINFSNSGLSSGTIVPITVGFASNFSTTPSYNFSTSVPVTVGAGPINSDGWQTVTSTFWYCGNPSKYMNFENSSWQLALLDNISLTQVQSPPPLLVSVSATNLTICAGQSTTLTPTVTNTRCGNNYLWSNGATTSSITVSPTTTTTYTVTVTDIDGCGTATSSPLTITVNPLPTVVITGSPTTICDGSSTTLTASGANTYVWTGGPSTATYSVSPTATTTYTVTGTNTVTSCSNTATQVVTVNPLPTVVITGSPTTICDGSSTTLTASGANTYVWTGGPSTATYSVSPTATTTYTVTGTNTVTSCSNIATQVVTVNPLPTITITGTTTICDGSSTTLKATGANSYVWTGGPSTATYSVSPTATTTYTVTGTNTVTSCSNTATQVVTVNPLPTITITGTTTICDGSSTTLTASGASTYVWKGGPSTATYSVSPTTTTTYTVTGTNTITSCSNTATQVVTVNPLPVIAISGTTTICDGSSTTLTASGANTYVWTGGPSTATYSVSPTATTTYTVTGTNTVTSCSNTATQVVKVNPLPTVGITASPATICYGASSTLKATGANSYVWTGGPSTATYTVSPTTTTTYTVTGTNTITSCSNTATQVVAVDLGPVVTISPSTATTCNGSPVNFVANGASTYVWSPAPILNVTTGVSVIASPTTATTTVTVVGTDVFGCKNSATATITENCCQAICTTTATSSTGTNTYPGGLNIPAGTSSTAYGGNNLVFTGCSFTTLVPSISISGTFTIPTGKSCTFDNCNIAMNPGSQINIQNGATLTINQARLFGCSTMWNGIVVEPGGTLNVINGGVIEDAITGIEGQTTGTSSGAIFIQNALLNNNYKDIVIDPCSYHATYPFNMSGSTLTAGFPDPFSNANLKAPYAGEITNTGIYLNTVNNAISTSPISANIVIGQAGSLSNQNTFSNMNWGIYAITSNFTVYNNLFQNIVGSGTTCITISGHPCPTPIGIAIYGFSANVQLGSAAIIGGTNPYENNTIINCFEGVSLTNYVYQQVLNDMFWCNNNILKPPFTTGKTRKLGATGVYIQTPVDGYLEVSNNTMGNWFDGIVIAGPGSAGMEMNSAVDLNSNHLYITDSKNGFMEYGIYVQNVFQPVSSAYAGLIWDNIVDSANYCVYLTGINSSGFSVANTTSSGYFLNILPSAKGDGTLKSGVYISNSPQQVSVDDEYIFATGTAIAPPSAPDTKVIGIYTYLSPGGASLRCNTVFDVGQGIRFDGNCGVSQVFSNTLTTTPSTFCYDGFALEKNAMIGTQGLSIFPSGNVWSQNSSFYNSETNTYNSNPANGVLYVAGTPGTPTNPLPALNLGTKPYSYPTTLAKATGNPEACPFVSGGLPGTGFDLMYHSSGGSGRNAHKHTTLSDSLLAIQHQMDLIVEDSIPYYELIPQTQYMNKQSVFNAIRNDSTFLANDTVLQHFYSNTQPTTMGTINTIQLLTISRNYSLAQSLNSLISPGNTIEQNHKDVKTIFFSSIALNDTLDTTQVSSLWNIANQCPEMGGRAVFEARYLLNTLYQTVLTFDDECGSSNEAVKPVTSTSEQQKAMVYPNPANTLLNVAVALQPHQTASVCLYNTMGEKVRCITLQNYLTEISTVDLPAGIYYYRITDNMDNLIKADKIIIIH